MALFNAIVRDVWRERQSEAKGLRARLESVVGHVRGRLDRVDDAFLHEHTIDRSSYERQRDKLREQLALAELELSEAVTNQLDVEGILGFAERVLTNVDRLWPEVSLEQKLQLQLALFPGGIQFDGKRFGTAVTCLAFKQLDGNSTPKSNMASPRGLSKLDARPRVGGPLRPAA